MQEIINWLVSLGDHNPDLVCLLVSGLAAVVAAFVYEWFFMPVAKPENIRRQQGELYVGTWLLGGTVSSLWWWSTDPADPLHVRLIVSYTVEIILPAAYFLAARWALQKFPFASVWMPK